jgi:hypothetical protein
MTSAIGVMLLASGAFLIWSAWTNVDPLEELQIAFGGKTTRDSDSGKSGQALSDALRDKKENSPAGSS